MTVTVVGPRNHPRLDVINTTSRGSDPRFIELSPFHLGPVDCYAEDDGVMPVMLRARNMENAWQYSKLYREHADFDGDVFKVSKRWADWRDAGFAKERADRYPMGKGAVPLCSYWAGRYLSYIEARREIYIPLYSKAVRKTSAYAELERVYKEKGEIVLWDFDGYLHRNLGMSFDDVIACTSRKMGHAFVLAMMLEGALP